MTTSPMTVKVSITDSHDGGNVEFISQTKPVAILDGGRNAAEVTVTVRIRPGKKRNECCVHNVIYVIPKTNQI
jgi:hypothetical protein